MSPPEVSLDAVPGSSVVYLVGAVAILFMAQVDLTPKTDILGSTDQQIVRTDAVRRMCKGELMHYRIRAKMPN